MRQAKIDTKLLVGITVISVLVLIAVWHLAGLPPGVMWWQAFR